MSFRRGVAAVHRWIGLATGVIILVVSLSGAIFVWERELFDLTHGDLAFVTPKEAMLPPEQLIEAGRRALRSDHPVTRITISGDSTRAAVVEASRTTQNARTFFQEVAWYDEAYVDQYTGRVLGVVDKKHNWLFITRHLHTSLLLSETGEYIVGISTIVFIAMCLIGLVLWWPRKWSLLPSRLRPKLTAAWKRAIFDAHNILGFYGLVGLLVLAITGPVWTFTWYTNAIAWTLTGEARLIAQPVPKPAPNLTPIDAPFSAALAAARRFVPNANRYMVDVPPNTSRVLTIGATYDGESLWEEYERYYFHPASAELLGDERFEEKNLAMKWRNSNYGIHTGTLFGWPMQLLATILCLLAASLPVTGAIIWYPRWKRKRLPRMQRAEPSAALGG